MRILHVVESLDPQLGGPSICAPSLACAQLARGDSPTLLYYASPSAATTAMPSHMASLPGILEVKLIVLDSHNWNERALALRARAWMHRHIAEYDVVHIHGVWRPILAAAAAIAYEKKVPYVIQPHGMVDPWSMSQKRLKKKLAWQLMWQRIFSRSACVHALNQTEAEGVQNLGANTSLAIVGNGVFRQKLAWLEVTQYQANPAPYILFLSRLHPKKGLDILAEAYRLYRLQGGCARLRVVGPDDGAGEMFKRAIDLANLSPYVDIEPPIYNDAKYDLMLGAACFCLPSYQEGFSVALLEAAACAIPLVISTECHFPEIQEAEAGRVVSLNPQAVADALQYFTDPNNEDLRCLAGQRGRELVRNHFTWEAVADKLDGYYRQSLTTDAEAAAAL